MGYRIRIEIEESYDDGETNTHTQDVYNNDDGAILTLDKLKDVMYYSLLGAGFTYVSDVIIETKAT